MASLLEKRFSLLHYLLTCCLAVAVVILSLRLRHKNEIPVIETQSCPVDVHRLAGLRYVKPIVFVTDGCEAPALAGIKSEVNDVIEKYKASGDALTASIYIRSADGWTAINPTEQYQPGSLFKVPMLMTALRMNEMHPGFLDNRVAYAQYIGVPRKVNFPGKTIKPGQSYTIRQLLESMIRDSDNQATALLQQQLDMRVMQKMFSDLGLTAPNAGDQQYLFDVTGYSIFFRAIFNAGYLDIDDSEYAAELLTQCRFSDGLRKGVPANIAIAHKFGESGSDQEKQLHESGIVYLDGRSYLLSVMTKGKDFGKLSALIADISATVYQGMKAR